MAYGNKRSADQVAGGKILDFEAAARTAAVAVGLDRNRMERRKPSTGSLGGSNDELEAFGAPPDTRPTSYGRRPASRFTGGQVLVLFIKPSAHRDDLQSVVMKQHGHHRSLARSPRLCSRRSDRGLPGGSSQHSPASSLLNAVTRGPFS
ncbi:hypothetical protein VTN96DRAFT_3756 [Rasamsonia emersonii]